MKSSYLQLVIPAVSALCCLLACILDVKQRRIPNWLTGPALLAGLLLHLLSGGWSGLGSSLGALLICGAVFLLFYVAGGMGAGDVKLIAALGALLGVSDVVPLLAFTAIFGGALAVLMAMRHGRLRETVFNVGTILSHHSQRGLIPHPDLNVKNGATLRLPYAVAIAGGTCLTLLSHTTAVSLW